MLVGDRSRGRGAALADPCTLHGEPAAENGRDGGATEDGPAWKNKEAHKKEVSNTDNTRKQKRKKESSNTYLPQPRSNASVACQDERYVDEKQEEDQTHHGRSQNRGTEEGSIGTGEGKHERGEEKIEAATEASSSIPWEIN